jgi:group II intron reverse transcriptase/maturase
MGTREPNAVSGNLAEHSVGTGNDPKSKRARIAVKARSNPKEKFNSLIHHLTFDLVREHLEKIPLKSAPGADGMTVKAALENLEWILPPILKAIHQGNYDAPPVRRVYIPKANGGQRPIGVPEVVDRAIQAAMTSILNEIYEQDFLKCSFGFRPKLSCHHALATMSELVHKMGMNYALEVDIRDFFGSLSHDWLRKFLSLRIGDKRVLKLIDSWLAAGIVENGRWQSAEKGTPQGGSISPLLSNVYLHYVLDLWFEKKIKRRLSSKAHLVRYADDFVILFQNPDDMNEMQALLTARFAQFGLAIAEEKTHKTDLTPRVNRGKDRRRINFLGFSIFRALTKSGKRWKPVFQTDSKRFTRAKATMKEKLILMMHWDVDVQAKKINAMLMGHMNYYGFAGNGRKVDCFWHYTIRMWRRSLSRRGQNGRITWDEITQILAKNKIVRPRVHIRYSDLPSYVRL